MVVPYDESTMTDARIENVDRERPIPIRRGAVERAQSDRLLGA
jgi:hypothetical protein